MWTNCRIFVLELPVNLLKSRNVMGKHFVRWVKSASSDFFLCVIAVEGGDFMNFSIAY